MSRSQLSWVRSREGAPSRGSRIRGSSAGGLPDVGRSLICKGTERGHKKERGRWDRPQSDGYGEFAICDTHLLEPLIELNEFIIHSFSKC